MDRIPVAGDLRWARVSGFGCRVFGFSVLGGSRVSDSRVWEFAAQGAYIISGLRGSGV